MTENVLTFWTLKTENVLTFWTSATENVLTLDIVNVIMTRVILSKPVRIYRHWQKMLKTEMVVPRNDYGKVNTKQQKSESNSSIWRMNRCSNTKSKYMLIWKCDVQTILSQLWSNYDHFLQFMPDFQFFGVKYACDDSEYFPYTTPIDRSRNLDTEQNLIY